MFSPHPLKGGVNSALPFLFVSFGNHQSLGHYDFVDS
jgi:hypothetical protein